MNYEIVLSKFTSLALLARFEVAEGDAQLCAVLIDIDTASTGHATDIQRVQVPTHAELRAATVR